MLFRQLFDEDSFTYTYLLATDFGKEAIIIDPVDRMLQWYLKLIKELELDLKIALDTHTHADHITATGLLRQHTGCQVLMGEVTQTDLLCNTLYDGEILDVGGLIFKVLHTPGHTQDSYCLLMEDRIFTGDTLLIRGTGRTDLPSGDPEKQYDSLFTRLLSLPEEILVYPAHDYKGMMVSTIKEERKYNPRLQVRSKEEYIGIMNNLDLPAPKLMDIALPENLKCGLLSQMQNVSPP